MAAASNTAPRGAGRPRGPAAHGAHERDPGKLAGRMVAFLGHGVLYAFTGLFFAVVVGGFATTVIMLAWGVGLAAHGYFGVLGPALRRRWSGGGVRVLPPAPDPRALEARPAHSLELLSASIAHEIRNPITAARSLVAQIGEDPAAPENAEYARVALEELDRVERSIAHLLRFARDEEVRPEEVHMADVLASSLESFRGRLDAMGVVVARELDTAGPVHADPEKMRRVVTNLVDNALDALEESRTPDPRLDVSLGENLAGTEVWMRIKDNGPGIPRDRIEKVFTPFHTSKADGTGLGLALSKKLVEAHGGTIEARSEPGAGAEIVVVLPKRAAAAS